MLDVSGEDVSAWYLKKANAELAELEGPLFEQATELSGAATRDRDACRVEDHESGVEIRRAEIRTFSSP